MVQGKYGSISYKTKQNRPRRQNEWYRVEGTHEPIIDRALWDRVQALIKQRTRPFSGGKTGIFAGKVRCAGCGYVMRSSRSHGRYYLKCPNRHVSKDACAGAFISLNALEQAVIAELNQLSAQYLDKNDTAAQIEMIKRMSEDIFEKQEEQLRKHIALYEKKISEYRKALQNLYLDKTKGILTESEFLSFSKNFTAEENRLERMLSDSRQALSELQRNRESKDNPAKSPEQYTNLEQLDREIVETMIDYIKIEKRLPGTDKVPIEIHWNF